MNEEVDNPVLPSRKYENPESAFFSGGGWHAAARSAGGRDIIAKQLISNKENAKRILLLGGVHGNETEGVRFMVDFCKQFAMGETSPLDHHLYLVPVFNPDGFLAHERKNDGSVDLNRNLPTKDWSPEYEEDKYNPGASPGSEPENQFLIKLIDDFKPDYLISFHSWKPMININGPALPLGEAMAKHLHMKIVDDIGYPTPGSLGTYTGWERDIPTITLEFERGLDLDSIYPSARDGVLASFDALG